MPSLLKRKPLTLPKATLRKSLLRSNPARSFILTVEDSELEFEFDDHVISGYRRPEIVKSDLDKDDDEELSEYVKLRLLMARIRAIEQAKKVWGYT